MLECFVGFVEIGVCLDAGEYFWKQMHCEDPKLVFCFFSITPDGILYIDAKNSMITQYIVLDQQLGVTNKS